MFVENGHFLESEDWWEHLGFWRSGWESWELVFRKFEILIHTRHFFGSSVKITREDHPKD